MGKRNKKKKGPRFYHKLHGYTLSKEYSIEEIEDKIKSNPEEKFFLDEEVTDRKIKLRRANYYAEIGYECVNPECGTVGDRYILGTAADGAIHLDLYGIDKDGDLHMITIDHIHPKSKGGRNHVSNYQAMCKVCNEKKADNIETN